MRTPNGFQMFTPILVLLTLAPALRAQKASGSKCPPVKPKNAEEALRIEESSNKNGCWVRDRTGQLVFVSSKAPDQGYVPLTKAPTLTGKPSCQSSGGAPGSGITGTWLLDQKCVANCPEPRPGYDMDAVQTVTITPQGPKLYQITFGSYPGADECMIPLRLTQTTPITSLAYVKASGTARYDQACATATVEVETRGANLFVRVHRADTWEGMACRTSAPPGVWLPNPYPPYQGGTWLRSGQDLNGPF
jgi:hypothetical protein